MSTVDGAPELIIRQTDLADIPAISDIYADAVRNGTSSYELEPPSESEMKTRFEALRDGGFPYITAESGGQLIGYAYAGAFRLRPAYRFIVEDSIYLAPAARGRGLGGLLLKRLIEDATALGFRQMIAVIGDGSPQSASVKLHERLGFRHSGLLEGSGYKHERWLDTVFMQLSMNGGTATGPDPQSLPERRFHGK